MQPTLTLSNALVWMTIATSLSCHKENSTPLSTISKDPVTVDIPEAFGQNILLNGFASASCSSCMVLYETANREVLNFRGRLSAVIVHKAPLGSERTDSIFDHFPCMPDSTVFQSMKQRFGISISSQVKEDSLFIKVVTGFSEDVTTPVKLAVWLTEDSVRGSQITSYNSNRGLPFYHLIASLDNYYYNHVLRYSVSASILGDPIDATRTTAGVRDIKNYAFRIPADCNREKIRIVAFAYTGVHLYGMVNNVAEAIPGETVFWN
jgi:hypothetical protein